MPPQQRERLLDFIGEGLRLGAHGLELFFDVSGAESRRIRRLIGAGK
ncbi:MAG: hypothetical protein ABJT35_06920 [Parasphingorhabdus sp.]